MNKLLFNFFFAFLLLFVSLFASTAGVNGSTVCNYSASSDGKKYVASFSIEKETRQDGTYYNPIHFQLYNGVQYVNPTIQYPKESLNIKDDKCPDVVLYYVDQDNKHNVMIGSLSDNPISTIMNYANTLPTRLILNSFVSNPNPNPSTNPSYGNTDNSNDSQGASGKICKYSSSDNKYLIDLIITSNSNGKYTYRGIRKFNGIDPQTSVIEANQTSSVYSKGCPDAALYYTNSDGKYYLKFGSEDDIKNQANYNPNSKAYLKLTGSEPYNPNTGNTGNNSVSYELDYSGSPCKNPTIKSAVKVVGKVISIIQIAVPIILILMALVDITKSIVSMDDSKSKKSVNHLIKRLISAVLVFFIIAIVRFVCDIVSSDSIDNSCLDIISDPWKK